MIMEWVQLAYRSIFAALDRTVGWGIEIFYTLLIRISDVRIFNDAVIDAVGSRVSVILGVVMLFKVSFSLITYAVSPDKISDKSTGIGKLITNSLIVLILLVSVNFVFEQAYRLQGMVLRSQLIPQIIFGPSATEYIYGNNQTDAEVVDTSGKQMAFYVFSAFMQPNANAVGDYCNYIYMRPDTPISIANPPEGVESETYASEINKICQKTLMEKLNNNTELVNIIFTAALGHDGVMLLSQSVVTARSGSEFIFNYQPPLSTVVGVVTLLVLVTFCIDIALRTVKLGFLQLIAPIPIISYVDPASNKMFKSWTKECGTTYLDVFIRLMALFFAIFVVRAVANNHLISSMTGARVTFFSDPMVKIFIILGALMFAKQLPKLIESITGAKLDGAFNLNPLKKLNEVPGLGALTGAGVGMVGRAADNFQRSLGKDGNKGKALLSGLGGAIGGGLGGAVRGLGAKTAGDAAKAQAGYNAKMRQSTLDGSTFGGRMTARGLETFGLASGVDREIAEIDEQVKVIENKIAEEKTKIARKDATSSAIDSLENRAKDKMKQGKGTFGVEYNRRASYAKYVSDNIGKDITDRSGSTVRATSDMAADAQMDADKYLNVDGMKDYMTHAIADPTFDAAFTSKYEAYSDTARASGDSVFTDGGNLDDQIGAIKGEVTRAKTALAPREREIADLKDKKAKLYEDQRKATANKNALNNGKK